jgi:hypothetical protein
MHASRHAGGRYRPSVCLALSFFLCICLLFVQVAPLPPLVQPPPPAGFLPPLKELMPGTAAGTPGADSAPDVTASSGSAAADGPDGQGGVVEGAEARAEEGQGAAAAWASDAGGDAAAQPAALTSTPSQLAPGKEPRRGGGGRNPFGFIGRLFHR